MTVVFLLSVALSLMALALAVQLRVAREEARSTVLTALCDAALAEALAQMAAGNPEGVAPHLFGDGTIASQVQAEGAQRFRITATATYGGKSRSAVAEVTSDAAGTRVTSWLRLSG
jgi:hypothetical protein